MTSTAASLALAETMAPPPTPRVEIGMHDRFIEALTAGVMGPRLSAALGRRSACHVLDAKYEPGDYAHILYEHGGHLIRAELVTDDQASPSSLEASRVVPPGVRIWRFPEDPDLPTLPRALDPGIIGSIVASAESRPETRAARVSLLRYRPGKRATLLVTMRAGGERYVAKVYHRSDKAAAVAAEANILATTSAATTHLRFAPHVTYSPELAVVVQRAVDGIPLDTLIDGRRLRIDAAAAGMRDAARALAAFHALPVATDRRRSGDRELVRFRERAARIMPVRPVVGATASSLARRLAKAQAMLPPAPVGPVHGDCKPSAFLLGRDGGAPYLLDLDHHGIADQTVDVGTFLASLRQLAIRRQLTGRPQPSTEALPRLANLFLEGYVTASGRHDLLPRIRWQEAVALERKALRAFSRAPLSPLPAALLQEADRCLDESWSDR